MSYLEFTMVSRTEHIHKGFVQPSEMSWSIEEYMKQSDKFEEIVDKKIRAKI